MILQYKDEEVLRGLFAKRWHPKLIDMYVWLIDRYGDRILLTCAHESRDYISLHDMEPLRAFDLRSGLFDNPQETELEINLHWIYDFNRDDLKVGMVHDVGRGIHFHIQVHGNTMKRGSL